MISIIAGVASLAWIALEILLTSRNKMFTPQQLFARYPDAQEGRPFLWHGGLWGDIFILTPLLAYVIGTFSVGWDLSQVLIFLLLGLVVSGFWHWIYAQTPFPDSLAWKGEGVTIAGWLHLVYMASAFAVFGLFYFLTPSVSFMVTVWVSLALMAHVFIGTHALGAILNRTMFRRSTFPDRLTRLDTWWIIIGTWGIIIILAVFF